MSFHLIFLFLFQSGLAFAFSYFIARVLLGPDGEEARSKMLGGMRKVRAGTAVLTAVLPVVLFAAYHKSLPEGKPATLAVWPAVWIFMILLAVVLAITVAINRKPMDTKHR